MIGTDAEREIRSFHKAHNAGMAGRVATTTMARRPTSWIARFVTRIMVLATYGVFSSVCGVATWYLIGRPTGVSGFASVVIILWIALYIIGTVTGGSQKGDIWDQTGGGPGGWT
jgi:hypothetical protein